MRKIKHLLSLVLILALCCNFASVTYGTGMPVIDVAAIAKYIEQLEKMESQLKLLRQNLQALDPRESLQELQFLQDNLVALKNIYDYTGKITMDYKTLQYQFDSVYKNFDQWNNGMGGADYIKQMNMVQNESGIAIKNAMMAQGLMSPRQYESDSASLSRLIRASQSSQGSLAATQAGNQIAAFQARQTMRMSQVATTSYRAETAYYAELQQKDNASKAFIEKSKIQKVTPPKKGPALPGINL